MHETYKLAGFKKNSVITPNKLEGKIKQYGLAVSELLKISKKVAKHDMDIAGQVLRSRDDDPEIQKLCVKAAMQILEGPQDRIEPKKNLNLNANVNSYVDAIVQGRSICGN
ncbi:MAG: hypothetical protein B6D34_08545 [Candidatus Brocadia sp. UTAMX1]|jgi:hypothetical protein|nr:MAG: hypothetical protein B6D34_08545 [Candidatus Brocadia sp. UTAMX1]